MAFGIGGKGDGSDSPSSTAIPSPFSNNGEAVLGRGCKIVGQVTLSGSATIDGTIEGEVTSDGTLTIGEAANLKARLSGADIVVKGAVTGDITASKRIALRKPAKVIGNLTAPVLSIEEGVVFEGKVTTTLAPKSSEAQKVASQPTK